jgi:hypothetical protein
MSNKLFQVTDVQIFVHGMYEENLSWGVNFAINNDFMIQFDSGNFSIPSGDEASWNDADKQTEACAVIDADDLARELDLPTTITELCEKFVPDWFGDEAQIERFKKMYDV